ncbi:MAG: hypothetical protein FJY76_02960 [Candidatus Aenigmarchaeota archaeon]|nr:hypothetical protein [Candidatus Aenigmarchaeota archaeon]
MEPEKAYVLGATCGDAYVAKMRCKRRPFRYRLRLAVNDYDFAKEFARCLTVLYGITPSVHKYRERYWVETNRMSIVLDILGHGDFRTESWRVPSEIINGDALSKCSFLRGFFDSEGFSRKYDIGFCSKNKQGLEDIGKLLESIGITPSLYLKKKSDGAYRAYIYGKEQRREFAELIGFSIERKQRTLTCS